MIAHSNLVLLSIQMVQHLVLVLVVVVYARHGSITVRARFRYIDTILSLATVVTVSVSCVVLVSVHLILLLSTTSSVIVKHRSTVVLPIAYCIVAKFDQS